MSLTSAQQEAVAARGNVVVVAGAGTGKTRTLVERCLSCLIEEQPPVSLDEILVVTFTEAAATEMRQRLRGRLEEELKEAPDNPRWQEQLALFETAHIGTLHSFCLQLVRQHSLELGLDPTLSVLAEEEASLLAAETLDEVLQRHYAGRDSEAEAVQQLIHSQGRGRDEPIRALVRRLHRYTQTLAEPDGWFRKEVDMYSEPEPAYWQQWMLEGIAEWRAEWLPLLEQAAAGNAIARDCAAALGSLPGRFTRPEAAVALEQSLAIAKNCPYGRKGQWLTPLKDFVAETEFLASLATATGANDPLVEDWVWVRRQMITLLQLAQEFAREFSEAKRERAAVDFHDLEQYALRLLWDAARQQPTDTAREWRKKLRFVFVDEYQDINAAQDWIIAALSREGAQANRFLVGDVKQSIYRFRLAKPRIFQSYVETWGTSGSAGTARKAGVPDDEIGVAETYRQGCRHSAGGRAIPLVENFRSHEGILSFVNSVFGLLMRREVGGVQYDRQAELRFGAADKRRSLGLGAGGGVCVELHLRLTGAADEPEDDENNGPDPSSLADLGEADKEARMVALRLAEMKAQGHPVWHEALGAFRPVEWRDMAVLLRSPANKAEGYAKEFARKNVPLLVTRTGFYESLEVLDLLSLLQVLDNPLQDYPVLATLHSPLVGLKLDELASIRLAARGRFWTALVRSQEPGAASVGTSEAGRKIAVFLERFARWRRLARQVALSRCLEAVLAETHYAEWLQTQPNGEQRRANVQRLLGLAQQFDQFQRRGLFRFLKFIEAQRAAEAEPEVAPVSDENAVRLMSIHQSKGLEFPVVVVADLSKAFNLSDLRAAIILDEVQGLCPEIQPPVTGARYPSLPHWLASRREKRELLGEEMRLLYVAMTRARDTLLLSAGISRKRLDKVWAPAQSADPPALLWARSCADWLGLWFSTQPGLRLGGDGHGESPLLRWAIHDDTELLRPGAPRVPRDDSGAGDAVADRAQWQGLRQRLAWEYPFAGAALLPAKSSVTALRRRAAEAADDDASHLFAFPGSRFKVRSSRFKAQSSGAEPTGPAADRGNAHHQFLQFLSLERVGSVLELKAEARRLQEEGALTEGAVALLDFEALAAFWRSVPGGKIRAQAPRVHRELRFTARFFLKDLAPYLCRSVPSNLDDEFVVVQGVADLVVLLPGEIWLVDFKTDEVEEAELAGRVEEYGPQVRIYARALSRIYHRPVSECWLYFLARQRAVAVEPLG